MKIDIYFIHVEQKFHIVGRSKETCDIDRLINGCIVCIVLVVYADYPDMFCGNTS